MWVERSVLHNDKDMEEEEEETTYFTWRRML
jgi:hypothetical protein